MFDKYEYDADLLFSNTARFTDDYKFINKNNIYKTVEIETQLEEVLKVQEKNFNKNIIVNVMIILDDVKIHAKSKELINLATYGRHFKITTILSSQFPRQLVCPAIRSNASYIFFSDLGFSSLKAIYELVHFRMSFKKFNDFVDENNHNFQFIFYDGMISDKDKIKIVKAKQYNNLEIKK